MQNKHNTLDNHPHNLPLVVGVSGHRDIHPADADHVSRAVNRFLDQLTEHTSHTELRIMVGMAEGADLLVAQVAVDRNLAVDAVLPMPLSEYLHDFDAESQNQLRTLLSHPNVRTVTLPSPVNPTTRTQLYTNLTESLILKSDVLLALWDGQPLALPGGTADTLLRYLGARTDASEQNNDISMVDEIPDTVWGPQFAYWVPTSRRGGAAATRRIEPCYLSAAGTGVLCKHKTMPLEFQRQLSGVNQYNQDWEVVGAQTAATSLDSLLGQTPITANADELSQLREVDTEYGKADRLAVYYQRRSDRLFRWFGYIAIAMGLSFLSYAKLSSAKIFISTYFVALVLGLVIHFGVQRLHWFSKHLVYRVLAETMRAKFFLRLIGADKTVDIREFLFMTSINQFDEFGWIPNALKAVSPLASTPTEQAPDVSNKRLQWAQTVWVDGQVKYFRKKVTKLKHVSHRLHLTKSGAFGAIVLLTISLLAMGDFLKATHLPSGTTAKDFVLFLMGLLPLMLGIWELYENKMASRELLWQYRTQLSRFSLAQLQLAHATSWSQRREILVALSKESLMESYLWSIHRYHREHEAPSAA